MSEKIESVARAICDAQSKCLHHQLFGKEGACIEPDGRNGPCRATKDQLLLSNLWVEAEAAIKACESADRGERE